MCYLKLSEAGFGAEIWGEKYILNIRAAGSDEVDGPFAQEELVHRHRHLGIFDHISSTYFRSHAGVLIPAVDSSEKQRLLVVVF